VEGKPKNIPVEGQVKKNPERVEQKDRPVVSSGKTPHDITTP
jgi:hypothetical protein